VKYEANKGIRAPRQLGWKKGCAKIEENLENDDPNQQCGGGKSMSSRSQAVTPADINGDGKLFKKRGPRSEGERGKREKERHKPMGEDRDSRKSSTKTAPMMGQVLYETRGSVSHDMRDSWESLAGSDDMKRKEGVMGVSRKLWAKAQPGTICKKEIKFFESFKKGYLRTKKQRGKVAWQKKRKGRI